jgi:hypothetical protein
MVPTVASVIDATQKFLEVRDEPSSALVLWTNQTIRKAMKAVTKAP